MNFRKLIKLYGKVWSDKKREKKNVSQNIISKQKNERIYNLMFSNIEKQ